MKDEKKYMNNRTYRECFCICDEVRAARAGKKIRMRDYPAAIVSCVDSWQNYMSFATESSGKANDLSYRKTPVLEAALKNAWNYRKTTCRM